MTGSNEALAEVLDLLELQIKQTNVYRQVIEDRQAQIDELNDKVLMLSEEAEYALEDSDATNQSESKPHNQAEMENDDLCPCILCKCGRGEITPEQAAVSLNAEVESLRHALSKITENADEPLAKEFAEAVLRRSFTVTKKGVSE